MTTPLPPLPDPRGTYLGNVRQSYTAEQVIAFGRACIAAERERAAKVCDEIGRDLVAPEDAERSYAAWECAAAIRKGTT